MNVLRKRHHKRHEKQPDKQPCDDTAIADDSRGKCSSQFKREAGMVSDDLTDLLKVRRAFASLQITQRSQPVLAVEGVRSGQFIEVVGTCGGDIESGAAVLGIQPAQPHWRIALRCAISSVEHVVQRIEADAQFPVFLRHENAIDLSVEIRDAIYAGAVDHQCAFGRVRLIHNSVAIK